MTVSALPRGTAESQGVDPAGILAFLDAVESAPDIEMHSLMIIRHGLVVAEGWWAPYTPEQVHLLYSLSKSFTSTAAAFAVAEGLLDLDATVLSYFPEFDGEITDPGSRSMLVRHVAAMASGHLEETIEQARALDPMEPVRGFLLIPPDRPPGHGLRLQPALHVLAGGDHPTTVRPDADRLPAAPAVRPAGHRPGRLAAASRRPRHRVQRLARDDGRARPTRPAVSAARGLERRPAALGGMGGRGHPGAGRESERAQAGLAAGLRLPVLDVPARVPRATARTGSSAWSCPNRTR